ncbi:MAG: hypothetical protein D6B25_16775 [Desulfobulbaceae bacterium]|nr:MAG: hypothetical protein D6B25_16775 [Desulfobulbaceae bacterium]
MWLKDHLSETLFCLIIIPFLLIVGGCADYIVKEELPTIAHVHIGHAVTGWKHTPDKQGLFVVAEKTGAQALTSIEGFQEGDVTLETVKEHTQEMLVAIDPSAVSIWKKNDYGLEKSLTEAIDHITFAAESDDASDNVKAFAARFEREAQPLINRCVLIKAVGEEILKSESLVEARALAEELVVQNRANIEGTGEGGEAGLVQLRTMLDEMINREDPPYEPVATKYLFGIIRLPSGLWAWWWEAPHDHDSDKDDGGGGGY